MTTHLGLVAQGRLQFGEGLPRSPRRRAQHERRTHCFGPDVIGDSFRGATPAGCEGAIMIGKGGIGPTRLGVAQQEQGPHSDPCCLPGRVSHQPNRWRAPRFPTRGSRRYGQVAGGGRRRRTAATPARRGDDPRPRRRARPSRRCRGPTGRCVPLRRRSTARVVSPMKRRPTRRRSNAGVASHVERERRHLGRSAAVGALRRSPLRTSTKPTRPSRLATARWSPSGANAPSTTSSPPPSTSWIVPVPRCAFHPTAGRVWLLLARRQRGVDGDLGHAGEGAG